MKRLLTITAILLCLFNVVSAEELLKQQTKYPDYAYMYLGKDKFEKLNRKVFAFNLGLNKYAIRPVHILWSSIMPEYGIKRIQSAYDNIEYPKRLVSSLIQKDFKTCGHETVRFLTNTTLGLGGLFDPAKKIFKWEMSNEDMEQALTKCKCCSGPYLVLPVMTGTTTRALAGKLLDTSLNPTTYVGTPVLAMVKAGLTVNRTSAMQPLITMVESTYADPYDIAKKMYGLDNYIKSHNYDRKDVLERAFQNPVDPYKDLPPEINPELVKLPDLKASNDGVKDELTVSEVVKNSDNIDDFLMNSYSANNSRLFADLLLYDYNPQNPVVDSMRTALFNLPDVNKSIWNELSIWNRSFANRIKTSSVSVYPDRENYKFKYIMQKDKTSPVAIIYPSIGEGITSSHSVIFAKLFYDAGYSVIIQGSHFQWEFVKSMPKDFRPGIPTQDVKYLREVTAKIVQNLEKRYNCQLGEKTVIGTSFGAMATLFLGDLESKENTLNVAKFIAICPPIDLMYAMKQVDKNGEDWIKNPNNLKERVAETAGKVLQLFNMKDESKDFKIGSLPFTEEEGKLITSFVMHQKLSDLIFTIENAQKNKVSDIYQTIDNMNYQDYMQKYILVNSSLDSINDQISLFAISDYLQNGSNYKIYHSLNDYLVNQNLLRKLKNYTGRNTTLVNNGAHLGFIYTPEFIEELKKEITLPTKTALKND